MSFYKSQTNTTNEILENINQYVSEQAFNLVEVMIIVLDTKANIVTINRKGCEILERPKEELIGLNWLQNFIPENQRDQIKEVLKIVSGDITYLEYYETPLSLASGNKKTIQWHNIFKDEFGQVLGLISSGADVSSHYKYEQTLKQSEQKYRQLLENLQEGIWQIDEDGKTSYVNESMGKILGYSPNEMISKSLFDFMSEEGKKSALKYLQRRKDGVSEIHEFDFLHKKGHIVHTQLATSALEDSKGQYSGAIAGVIDITDKKNKEIFLEREKNIRSISLLAGGIAHDFNNILVGVIGNIELLNLIPNLPLEAHEILENLENSTSRAVGLTRQLLTFAKGGTPVRNTRSIPKILMETVQFLLSGSNIKLVLDIDENIPEINVDGNQISQVFSNLIYNAKEAMNKPGTIKIQMKIENQSSIREKLSSSNIEVEENYLKISIEDTGKGIPLENYPYIFSPYFTTKEKGNGLGLATCYSIIKQHKGIIEFSSELNKGSTFNIYLPLDTAKQDEDIVSSEILTPFEGKVLIMDDDEIVRKTLKLLLEKLGFEVDLSNNGSEALEKYINQNIHQSNYKFVIMDLTIPGELGGKDTIIKLRKIDPNVKVIVSSGYSNDPIISNYQKYGFNGRLIKPYSIKRLNEVVKSIISN